MGVGENGVYVVIRHFVRIAGVENRVSTVVSEVIVKALNEVEVEDAGDALLKREVVIPARNSVARRQ